MDRTLNFRGESANCGDVIERVEGDDFEPIEIGKFSDNGGWKSNRGKGCTRVINVTRSKHNMAEI